MGDAAATPGAMAAVACSYARLLPLLERFGLDVRVANHNAPEQLVIAGPTEAVELASKRLSAEGIQVQALNVATAFHSPVVEGATVPFRQALEAVPFGAAGCAVYANASAEPYPAEAAAQRDLLAGQIARPVRFVEMIERMAADGVDLFVEVGPDAVLTRLAGRILEGKPQRAVATDRKGRDGVLSLLHALGQLGAAGVPLELGKLWEAYEAPPPAPSAEKRMLVPVQGNNYGKPYPPLPGTPVAPPYKPATPRGRRLRGGRASAEPDARSAAAPVAAAAPAPVARAGAGRRGRRVRPAPGRRSPRPSRRRTGRARTGRCARPISSTPGWRPSSACSRAPSRLTPRSRGRSWTATRRSCARRRRRSSAWQPWWARRLPVPPCPRPSPPRSSAPRPALRPRWRPRGPRRRPLLRRSRCRPVAAPPVATPRPAPAPVAPPPAAAPAAPRAAARDLTSLLAAIVADKTGYPAEMLRPEMALEADLGIDSIKRVEILSAVRDAVPELPALDPKALGALQTLGEVADKLRSSLGDAPSAARVPAAAPVGVGGCGRARARRDGAAGGHRGRQDRIPGRDAPPRDGAGSRPRHRLHQARRDPLGHARRRPRAAIPRSQRAWHPQDQRRGRRQDARLAACSRPAASAPAAAAARRSAAAARRGRRGT